MEAPHSALDASIYRFSMMGHTSRHNLRIPKFLAQNGSFVATKKVMSQHGSYLCRSALIVACSFLSRHISLLSFLILSRHSFVDVVCFMSQHKFPPSTLQLFCNSLCYVATFFLLLFSISVAIEFLQVAWICFRDRLFFVTIELCCLILLRLNSVSRKTLSTSQHNLL